MYLQCMHSVGQFLPDSPIDHLVLFYEAFTGKGFRDYLNTEVVTGASEILHTDLGAGNTGFN